MIFGLTLGTFMWVGIAASAAKLLGHEDLTRVSWWVVTYPIYGTILGTFLLGFVERYVPEEPLDVWPDDDDKLAPS